MQNVDIKLNLSFQPKCSTYFMFIRFFDFDLDSQLYFMPQFCDFLLLSEQFSTFCAVNSTGVAETDLWVPLAVELDSFSQK